MNKKQKQSVILAGAAIILVIIVAIVCILLAAGNNKKDDETNVNATPVNANTEATTAATIVVNDTVTQTTASATKETVNTQTTQAQVETAAVNDEQDPQNLVSDSNSGVEQNVTGLNNTNSNYSNGIDVSKYQGRIDWNKVKASGIDYAMIRVGYRADKTGLIYEDPYAAYNLQHAQAAGVQIGVYFFSTAISATEATIEANWLTNYISKYSITYPVVYNCEGFTSSDSRMNGITNSDRTAIAMTFLNVVKNAGYDAVLYAAKSELEGNRYWDTDTVAASYHIWVAQYPDVPYPVTTAPDYSGKYIMWQYTNKGVVDGINGYVDMNVAYFSYNSSATAKNTEETVVAADNNPELGITFVAATDFVTAKIETNLRTAPTTEESTVVVTLKNGEYVARTGIGDNGWSRLIYNGQVVYAISSYLTN